MCSGLLSTLGTEHTLCVYEIRTDKPGHKSKQFFSNLQRGRIRREKGDLLTNALSIQLLSGFPSPADKLLPLAGARIFKR